MNERLKPTAENIISQTEVDKEKTRQIALRVKDIVEKSPRFMGDVSEVQSFYYENKDKPNGILLSVLQSNSSLPRDSKVPDGISLPVYIIKETLDDPNWLMDTPYGKLPKHVKNRGTGIVFGFLTYFVVNEKGQGFKKENVSSEPQIHPKDAQNVDFSPDTRDSRMVALNREDFERIDNGLKLIEKGAYTELLSDSM